MSPTRRLWPRLLGRPAGCLMFLFVVGLWRCDFIHSTNHYDDMTAALTNTDILARQAGRQQTAYILREEGGQLVARALGSNAFLAAADLPAARRHRKAVEADVCRMATQALRPR